MLLKLRETFVYLVPQKYGINMLGRA